MEKNVEVGEKDEIHENIQFYIDNIQGISNELDVLKGNFIHENIQFYIDEIQGISNELDVLKGNLNA